MKPLKWFKRKDSTYIEKERIIRIGDSSYNRSFNYAVKITCTHYSNVVLGYGFHKIWNLSILNHLPSAIFEIQYNRKCIPSHVRAPTPLKFQDNIIITSKYSIFTFLPKNLIEQFQRIANAYFLGLLILQLIPQISSLTPITTVIPLVCVLSLTALKDGIDDLRRHHNDKLVNNRESFVLRNGQIIEERWRKVEVGDILKLTNDQFVAADMLLISSSEPNGLCYIETAELDGETNLKCRQALPDTAVLEDNLNEMENLKAEILCEPPNNRLNKFEGTITLKGKTLPLDNDQVLLRGCVLRNTKWCYGTVLFAGKDTKLMQNSGKDTFKRTSIDRLVNVLIIGIFIFLVSICLFTAIAHGIWQSQVGIYFRVVLPWASFISPQYVEVGIIAISSLTFLSYLILLNTLVPISLYVSVEMIRIAHSFWINWDVKMYDTKSGTAAKARTTTLNEELGQIQYIFSDKTGTLTQNIMCFKKCSVLGQLYGYVQDDKGNILSPSEKDKSVDFSQNPYYEPKFKFYDQRLVDHIANGDPHAIRLFTLLALCHTVMPGEKNGQLEYLAQSPDEGALVSAARNFGIVFKSRTPKTITIERNGKEIIYQLLAIFDFNNVRKRMSVIVKKEGKITLYCKGADSVIIERLDPSDVQSIISTTLDHLTKFAVEGLRTLCLAYKDINPSIYRTWEKKYEKTNACLTDREARLDLLYEEMEKDLHLIGATAVEDKLQDGVPETIANLLRAGIRIWVLTGDKQETAINIGYSCQLLNDDVEEIYVIDGQHFEEVERELSCVRKTASVASLISATPSSASSINHPRDKSVASSQNSSKKQEKKGFWSRLGAYISPSTSLPAGKGGKYLEAVGNGTSDHIMRSSYDQWEEWNDRIRRNFYWLIAPPSYNYNYNYTNQATQIDNAIKAPINMAASKATLNDPSCPTISITTAVAAIDSEMTLAPIRGREKFQTRSAAYATSTHPTVVGAKKKKGGNGNTMSGPTGLRQPEIEGMRIDVSVTPPHSDTSLYHRFNQNNNNNDIIDHPPRKPNLNHNADPSNNGGALRPENNSTGAVGGRKSPVSPYESRLRYPARSSPVPPANQSIPEERSVFNYDSPFLPTPSSPPYSSKEEESIKDEDISVRDGSGRLDSPPSVINQGHSYQKPAIFALVISGHSLVHALDPRLEAEFIELGSAAMAVICCRVTPLQKAMVVDVVRRRKQVTTLAIGDGANDVSMIRTANIGVGISGLEGRQAVLAADFAIAQFRFLERLILVHGRWSYFRMTKFLRYFFYKNFAFTLCSFWYGFFCGFSAQSLFDPWFISFYNLFYTSLPVLALAFFEQDVDEEMCLRYPQLYRSSLGNKLFNKKIFAQSILHGIVTSFILFIIPYFAFLDGMSSQGKETGLFVFGIVVSTSLIFTVSLQAGLDTTYWTGFNHFVIWGSIIFYLAMHFLMYSPIFNRTYVGVMLAATGQPKFWFTIMLTVAILILPVLAIRVFFCDTRPNLSDRIRYAQRIYNSHKRMQQKKASRLRSQQDKHVTTHKFFSSFPLGLFPPPHFYNVGGFKADLPRTGSSRTGPGRASIRTGYAFAHEQGFGDLIIKGTSFRPLRGSFSATAHGLNPKDQGTNDDANDTEGQTTSTIAKFSKSVEINSHQPLTPLRLLDQRQEESTISPKRNLLTFLPKSPTSSSATVILPDNDQPGIKVLKYRPIGTSFTSGQKKETPTHQAKPGDKSSSSHMITEL